MSIYNSFPDHKISDKLAYMFHIKYVCRLVFSVVVRLVFHNLEICVKLNLNMNLKKIACKCGKCRSQWPYGLRRRSSATLLLRWWVRIPPGAWMFVCCECCVLLGRGICDGLITRLGELYRLWRIVVCDQETSKTRRLKPATGL